MIGTIDIEVQAKNPNMPLWPLRAYVNSPSSIRVRNVPKRVGDWNISRVYLTVVYPDGTIKQADCVQTGGVWVGTVEGTATSGTCENGYTVFADGTDENGNPVTGYVLGKGDVEILEADGTLSPDPARYYVKLLSAEAAEPREGDMYPTEGGYVIWQSGQAHLLGTPFDQITSYVESAVSAKADLSALDEKQDKLPAIDEAAICAYVDNEYSTKVHYSVWDEDSQQYNYYAKSFNLSGEVTREMVLNDLYPQDGIYAIKFGTGVSAIGDNAFYNHQFLVEVSFKDSIKRIGECAFYDTARLTRVEFENDGSYYPNQEIESFLSIGLSAFANSRLLYYVKLPSYNKIWCFADSFKGTFQQASFAGICPYRGVYFNGCTLTQDSLNESLSHSPGLSSIISVCHPWNTVSKEIMDSQNYGKDFKFVNGTNASYASRRWTWTLANKTFYNAQVSSIPTGTKTIRILEDTSDHTAREIYVDLSTSVAVANSAKFQTGAAVDWYLNGELSDFTEDFFKVGTRHVWHFMEYQPNRFMVEKVGAAEESLSAKADKQELSAYVMQNGTAVINSLTCDQLVANQAHIVGYATSSDLSAKADVSALHQDYIEDSAGNRINANLSCTYIDNTAWEVTDPSSNKYVLEYVGFIQSYHTWECIVPENIKLVLTYANDWEFQVYTWQETGPGGDYDWVLDINGSYDGNSDITTIPYFVNRGTTYNYSAQRPVTKHLTLATKEYVDSRLSALEARIAALEGN